LQTQKEQLTKQLQEQIDINKDIDGKRRQGDDQVHELQNRVKTLDANYSTAEVYRENLKQDRAKFVHFLESLAAILNIENIPNDIAHELNPDVILSRAEQLMKLEKTSAVEQKSSVYNLQRKLSQMKEQLDNKDLHLDLLRKKIVALEETRAGKNEFEREIDDHVMLARKMKVKVDHLTQQVHEYKQENVQLKAQMLDIETLKVDRCRTKFVLNNANVVVVVVVCRVFLFVKNRLANQERETHRLLDELNQLNQVRDKQAVKIASLQDRIHCVDDDAHRTMISTDNTVRALSNEVRFLKSSLEQMTEREQRVSQTNAFATPR
jgi:chromosome segregation ATPase